MLSADEAMLSLISETLVADSETCPMSSFKLSSILLKLRAIIPISSPDLTSTFRVKSPAAAEFMANSTFFMGVIICPDSKKANTALKAMAIIEIKMLLTFK